MCEESAHGVMNFTTFTDPKVEGRILDRQIEERRKNLPIACCLVSYSK